LAWAEWDGEFVLYHRPSGKTHFLNATTALLLTEILIEPKSTADATTALLATQIAAIESEQHQYVAELLKRLESLGLVECM
jgi:PqqD family protein of HPr-rel-A system